MQINRARHLAIALSGTIACASTSALAYESGFPGSGQPAGLFITATAGVPGPGIYMFDQLLTYQAKVVGPGAPLVNGTPVKVTVASEANGFLFVPGWTFLGATYDAVIVQPFAMSNSGFNPSNAGPVFNTLQVGARNTYVVPVELSWKLGDSGFFVKTGLGFQLPTGTITGANGLTSIGSPWYTIQPELLVSYLKDGWALSANLSLEINTASTVTGYTSGDVLHAEFRATKSIGKWTVGPVGYYMGQVSDDTSSAFYHGAINLQRYNIFAAGLLVGYDFGGAQLNVWAVDQYHADARGGTPRFTGGPDSAAVATGWKVLASLSYRLWAPDAPAAQPALHRK